MKCPHGVDLYEVCEECQSERDMGLVWRENKRGELRRVRKSEERPRVRLAYEKAKRGR